MNPEIQPQQLTVAGARAIAREALLSLPDEHIQMEEMTKWTSKEVVHTSPA